MRLTGRQALFYDSGHAAGLLVAALQALCADLTDRARVADVARELPTGGLVDTDLHAAAQQAWAGFDTAVCRYANLTTPPAPRQRRSTP